MRDHRINKWADVLVNYSLEAKAGQYAVIAGEVEALPLIEACYEKFVKAGAIVETFVVPKLWTELLFRFGNDKQIETPLPALKYAVEHCDLYLGIGAETNSKLLANFDPKKHTLAAKARKPILDAILNRAAEGKMSWTYTHFPTAAAAQDSNMGTREYEEFIFSLGHLNEEDPVKSWKRMESYHDLMIDYLKEKRELHFINSAGTDLKVNVDGMKWVNCSGKINFPDGEIYTGPNLNSPCGGVNGVARYSMPTIYRNVEVNDIELIFKHGAVVQANASKGEGFLREMIQSDLGAKYVGEIAIGTNQMMNKITKNILFDEKFGGTFHLALGKGYPQTGNTNESSLHWDIIFDLRSEGAIYADGELFLKDGKFVFEGCLS